jgi:hypothetical protein
MHSSAFGTTALMVLRSFSSASRCLHFGLGLICHRCALFWDWPTGISNAGAVVARAAGLRPVNKQS